MAALKHDAQGFLVGDPIDIGRALAVWDDIRSDIRAIRKAVMGASEAAVKGGGKHADASRVIAHRGGMEGLRFAQRSAQAFLHGGGAAALRGLARAQAIGHAFVKRNLSPGGTADILAAACWMQRIGALTPQWTHS